MTEKTKGRQTATELQARSLLDRGPEEPDRPWRTRPKTTTERQAAGMLGRQDHDADADDRPTPTRGDLNRARRTNERLREELAQRD